MAILYGYLPVVTCREFRASREVLECREFRECGESRENIKITKNVENVGIVKNFKTFATESKCIKNIY